MFMRKIDKLVNVGIKKKKRRLYRKEKSFTKEYESAHMSSLTIQKRN